MHFYRVFLMGVLFFSVLFSTPLASATTAMKPIDLRVGVYLSPPFVMKSGNGTYYGLAMDIWGELSKEHALRSTYIEYTSFENMLKDVEHGKIDFALSNITVTHERAQRLLFTYPWAAYGFRIMVDDSYQEPIINILQNNDKLLTALQLGAFFVVSSLVVTVVRRSIDKDFTNSWVEGVSISFYALVKSIRSGDFNLRKFGWPGHLISAIWLLFGVAAMGYILSSLTAALTVNSLTNNISSFSDLYDKNVAVIRGSSAELYLQKMQVKTIPYDTFSEATKAVRQHTISSFVSDGPGLEYWDKLHGNRDIRIVGKMAEPDNYAFAANNTRKELVDALSLTTLKIIDNGMLKQFKESYFDSDNN